MKDEVNNLISSVYIISGRRDSLSLRRQCDNSWESKHKRVKQPEAGKNIKCALPVPTKRDAHLA